MNPLLIEFLDAKTYEEKIMIFSRMEGIDDFMIDTMAAALDTFIRPGDISERKAELKQYLMTQEKFECNRLR